MADRQDDASGSGPPLALRAQLAFSSDDDGAAFVQGRVAKVGLFGAALIVGFAAMRLLLFALGGTSRVFFNPALVLHLAAVGPMLAMWLLCRRGQRSVRFSAWVEMICVSLSGLLAIGMGALMPVLTRPDMIVVHALTLVMVARAIYVPSTPRRTALMCAVLAVPYVAMIYRVFGNMPPGMLRDALDLYQHQQVEEIRRMSTVMGGVMWTASSVTAVAASWVIYGLREKVREVRQLGQYQLQEKLGEGGMGVVYRAQHALLRRPTAVKLLASGQIGERSLERFEREVRQTARLTHPNTITIYDYGRTADGVFYYAMELLDGVTLDAVVQATGPLPPARAIHLLRQVAASLAEAHGIGLVHRDIKPDNIMLCEQGGIPDTVKVLDFGLVKEVARGGANGESELGLTGANLIVGTPQYMAPEALTTPDRVDARADVYAFAATAYYLLSGRDVFEAETLVELCSHHLHTTPAPLSERVAGIPPPLEALVLESLAKDPSQRPRDGRALLERLEACDSEAWTAADAHAWWRRWGDELARPGGVSATAPTLLAAEAS